MMLRYERVEKYYMMRQLLEQVFKRIEKNAHFF